MEGKIIFALVSKEAGEDPDDIIRDMSHNGTYYDNLEEAEANKVEYTADGEEFNIFEITFKKLEARVGKANDAQSKA